MFFLTAIWVIIMSENPSENSKRSSSIRRRSFLAATGAVLGGAAMSGSAIAGSPSSRVPETIPVKAAEKAAEQKRSQVAGSGQFTAWTNATLGDAAPFYIPTPEDESQKYARSAYVFPVRKKGKEVGYITAGAHRSLEPILEYSTDTSPVRKLSNAKSVTAQQADLTAGRPIYTGGITYGLEVGGGQVLNVQDGSVSQLGPGSPTELKFTSTQSEHRWELVEDGSYGEDREYGTDDVSTMDANLSGVPAWTETDPGNKESTSIGTGGDTWDDWDGCTPIAASMVIGFHENVYEWEDDEREAIIDRLHMKMETNASGSTAPIEFVLDLDGNVDGPGDLIVSPMVEGIEDYTEGSHDYSATQHINHGPEFVLAEIAQDERPFILNMAGGGRAEDYPPDEDTYDQHSVCVVGYNNDGTDVAAELEIHDTWNSSQHILSYANWWAHSSISVSAD